MRVLLQCDMEAISQIRDFKELIPIYPEYWSLGRPKLMADVKAAVAGLLDGGASSVSVLDAHGSGRQNLVPELFPSRSELVDGDTAARLARAGAFDGAFQLGYHARTGTNTGFVPHTVSPALRMAVNGDVITESHVMAFDSGAPVLGVTGDVVLEPELTGALAGTPFLGVQRAISRSEAVPLYDEADAAEAIRAFAYRCARSASKRTVPTLSDPFTLAFSMDPRLAASAEGKGGLVLRDSSVLEAQCSTWWEEGVGALGAAIDAVSGPWLGLMEGIDMSSYETARRDSDRRQSLHEAFVRWLQTDETEWC